jgi:hypothetical protein
MVYRSYFSWCRWCTATNRPGGGTTPLKNHLHKTFTALFDFGVRTGSILREKKGISRRDRMIGPVPESRNLERFGRQEGRIFPSAAPNDSLGYGVHNRKWVWWKWWGPSGWKYRMSLTISIQKFSNPNCS